jgi:SAM-dependent methyltransferase
MLSLEKQNQLREQYRQLRPNWHPATEVYAQLVKDYVKTNSRVLDLGCGRGGLVEQLAQPLEQLVGIDPDWQSLREHRLALPRVVGVSGRLPFAAASFDLIFASWLLEHLENPVQDLAEISRVLRPGGVFVFITPNAQHPLGVLNRLFGRFAAVQGRLVEWLYGRTADDAFPTRYRANTVASLQTLSATSNLQLVTLLTIPDPTYIAFTPLLFRLMCWFESWLRPERRLHLVGVMEKTL